VVFSVRSVQGQLLLQASLECIDRVFLRQFRRGGPVVAAETLGEFSNSEEGNITHCWNLLQSNAVKTVTETISLCVTVIFKV
jgi:hypothetical protein